MHKADVDPNKRDLRLIFRLLMSICQANVWGAEMLDAVLPPLKNRSLP